MTCQRPWPVVSSEADGDGVRPHRYAPAGVFPTRMLVDRAPKRYAVIDTGTTSIKFRIAELDADGRGP
jgi:hypothetical protein